MSDQPYTGENRRALEPQGWHLDKKVPLTLIFAMLMQGAMVIWAIADIKKDVELLKADSAVLHLRDTQQGQDLRESMALVREQYREISDRLQRLIERGQK